MRRVRGTALILCLTAGLVTSWAGLLSGETKSERVLLATVNSDSIFTTDIDAIFASLHSTMSARQKDEFDYHKLLNKLINDRLLIQEALALGTAEEDYFRQFMEKRTRELVANTQARRGFKPNDSVSEASVQEYFAQNYRKYQVRTLSVESKAAADSMLMQMKSGVTMDTLAKQRSVDIHRYQGGLRSYKYWADVEPELKGQLIGAKKGALIGPFPYREVTAIMKIEDLLPADTSELPKYREYIESILKSTNKRAAWGKYIEGLRAQYGVTIDSAAIADISRTTKSALDSTFQRGSEKVVASCSTGPITTDGELRQETAHAAMSNATAPVDTLLYQALDKKIEDEILYRAGVDAGIDTLAAIRKRLAATQDSALIEVYLKETVVERVKFNHEEFAQYYAEHEKDFREPYELNLRQVLIGSKERADSAAAMLQDGADFDYVANKYREVQKELSEKTLWASLSEFPPSIQADFDKLTPGQATKAYQTPDGWIIFKILDRKEGRLKTLDEVDLKIREVMFQRKFGSLLDETLARLKANSAVVTFDEAIEQYLGAEN
ncbi:MAG: peptidyl-prolyl cis-trans isomerase [Candidatus Zixiibacteriota bacterium]